MGALSVPWAQSIEYGPGTLLKASALEPQLAAPETPAVAGVSPFLNPLRAAVNAGLGSPYCRLASCAVTVSGALVIVRLPATRVAKS